MDILHFNWRRDVTTNGGENWFWVNDTTLHTSWSGQWSAPPGFQPSNTAEWIDEPSPVTYLTPPVNFSNCTVDGSSPMYSGAFLAQRTPADGPTLIAVYQGYPQFYVN